MVRHRRLSLALVGLLWAAVLGGQGVAAPAATRAEVALRGEGLTTTLTRPPAVTPSVATDRHLTVDPQVLIVFH